MISHEYLYIGEWKFGKFNGRGLYIDNKKVAYLGEFNKDLMNGKGIICFLNKSL